MSGEEAPTGTGAEIALNSLMENIKPGDVDKFLASLTKYEKLMDKGMSIISKLDKMGILPAAIRAFGTKQGIPDIDKPLANPLALVATTSSHKLLYGTLNNMPEETVIEMFKKLSIAEEVAKQQTEGEAEVVEEVAE